MKEIVYLVYDEGGKYKFEPFAEQMKVFKDADQAMKFAISRGWNNGYFLTNFAPGQKNVYWAGDIKLSIMALEVN